MPVTGTDEVLIKIEYRALCATDVHRVDTRPVRHQASHGYGAQGDRHGSRGRCGWRWNWAHDMSLTPRPRMWRRNATASRTAWDLTSYLKCPVRPARRRCARGGSASAAVSCSSAYIQWITSCLSICSTRSEKSQTAVRVHRPVPLSQERGPAPLFGHGEADRPHLSDERGPKSVRRFPDRPISKAAGQVRAVTSHMVRLKEIKQENE